ncbi:MAG: hypothetical protein WDM76_08405 [Limisphaerales bacterium]
MDSAARINGGKPVATVTVGSVTLPIYSAPVTVKTPAKTEATKFKIYPSYQVSHYEGARRILRRCNTLAKARQLAKEIAGRLNLEGARRISYRSGSPHFRPRQDFPAAAGLEVDGACRKFAELQRRLKTGTLELAVDFFNAYGQNIRHGVNLTEVYAAYLEHLTKRGVGRYHARDVKRYAGGFVEAFPVLISAVETSQIDIYIARLGGNARNKNNHRKGIIALFNFAQEKGFLPLGIPHAAAATTEFCDPRQNITSEQQALDLLEPNDIYSPDELRRILAAVEDLALQSTLEIKAFSGVRTEEIVRLWWVMVSETEECIRVPDAVGKIAARQVPLLPNLKSRLAAYPADFKRNAWPLTGPRPMRSTMPGSVSCRKRACHTPAMDFAIVTSPTGSSSLATFRRSPKRRAPVRR